MASREERLTDASWDEVWKINTYVVFIAYISVAIKGLGFLMLTWTTVVLLGGFVDTLNKKDFWSLTIITLIQAVGIFNVDRHKRFIYAPHTVFGLMSVFGSIIDDDLTMTCFVVACILFVVQVPVLITLLYCMSMFYTFGIVISGGISLWRLIDHDYGGSTKENLVPAMDTLYYMALLQGVLFCYRFIFLLMWKRIVKTVATTGSDTELNAVHTYLGEMSIRCNKDPSLVEGRNLITHAVDMIGSSSPVQYICGVETLYTAIVGKIANEDSEQWGSLNEKRMLMKHLVLSASSTHILQKLLETLDSRGMHERVTRTQAATIVERLAFNINLEQFPRGIQHISSLIDTFEQYSIAEPYDQDCLYDQFDQSWKLQVNQELPSPEGELGEDYRELLLQGLHIFWKLAANETNCRIMSDTRGLVSKIMAPVTFDLLEHCSDDHGAWSEIVEASMKVLIQLSCAPKEVRAKLHCEISSSEGAINTLWRILNCDKCNDKLKGSAIRIFTEIYMDTESSRATLLKLEGRRSIEDFVRKLMDIFTQDTKSMVVTKEEEKDNKYISIRECSGLALSEICFRGGSSDAAIIIQKCGGGVDSLIKVLEHEENEICRQAASEILEHLCTHYTKAGESLGNAMIHVFPKVIEQIIHYENRAHIGKDDFAKPEIDIESQSENGQGKDLRPSSYHQQNNLNKVAGVVLQSVTTVTLLSSLLSLCGMVINTLSPDFNPQFDAPRFLNKLKKIVLDERKHTVKNLSLLKAMAKMAISLIKHGGKMSDKKEELKGLIEGLSGASRTMIDLDYSMIFNSAVSSSATTWSNLDRRTLVSLVKEAQELHALLPSTCVFLDRRHSAQL